jgi:hypothetical protein
MNSLKIIKYASEYFQEKIKNGEEVDFYERPPKITKRMLMDELMCGDLKLYGNILSADYLWQQYYYINTSSNNVFGFTKLPINELRKPTTRQTKTYSVRVSSKNKTKK